MQNALRGIGKPYVESLYSRSDLPPDPSYGSNRGHKIADFVFLPYISFINAFTELMQNALRGIGKPYVESLYSRSDLPPDPLLLVKLG